mgnify:CR=1 FL=1
MPFQKPRKSKHLLLVKRSKTGLGLFAKKDIPFRSFIIEYHGPMLNAAQADRKGGKYLFEISKKCTIDGTIRSNLARYINHSCKPNCRVEIDGNRVFIFSRKNIFAGEELSYDYGEEYFDEYIKPHGCKCPAKH